MAIDAGRQRHGAAGAQQKLVRLFEKGTKTAREGFGARMAEQCDRQCSGTKKHEGRDLLTLDDVALLGGVL